MGMVCKDKCNYFWDKFSYLHYFQRDEQNRPVKYCSLCVYYIFTDQRYCKCCGTRFRYTPAKKPHKKQEITKENTTEEEYFSKVLGLISHASLE